MKPKFASHIWTKKTTVKADSIAFVCPNCGCYIISDVSKGENPQLTANWINYPRVGSVQFRLAGLGKLHVERLSYYVKLPSEWKEWLWIILPQSTAKLLSNCAEKDPFKLESWMT